MGIKTRQIEYTHGDVLLQGLMAWDDQHKSPRPGVLVSHAWRGRSEFENEKARELARLGYTGFALDLYGKGICGSSPEENRALMQPFLDDRAMLRDRLLLALETMRAQAEVNDQQTAAIGYCFGGLCVLDLARCGADIKGAVSFHGLLGAPAGLPGKTPQARILVLHGWNDPMATPSDVLALAEEFGEAGADWQLHAYGTASHAFTNPAANDAAHGLLYDASADRRSWSSMQSFLQELFI